MWIREKVRYVAFILLLATVEFGPAVSTGEAQETGNTKVRIAVPGVSLTSLMFFGAQKWKVFAQNGLDAELILMRSSAAAAALVAGEVNYFGGVGPASVRATLSGMQSRAIWFAGDRLTYKLVARPELKNLEDLKSKKIGISGLGGTRHVALTLAVEKVGANPKDFTLVVLPAAQLLQSLESGFIDAASLDPPFLVDAVKQGFRVVLDIQSLVEMPVGGLTTMIKTIEDRPDEVKRVIRSVQKTKELIINSKEKGVALIVNVLKMDKDTASKSYDILVPAIAGTGIPTRVGIQNIIKSLEVLGSLKMKDVTFEDVADPRFAAEVARELGSTGK
jgi:NitT/TauT family transport system substrate-binding protein